MGAGIVVIIIGVIIAIWQSSKRRDAAGKPEMRPEDEAFLSQQARKVVDDYHRERDAEAEEDEKDSD